MKSLDIDCRKKMLYDMIRIRRVEERIDAEYLQDRMRTPVHLSTGQEAIAVGACSALRRDDAITSNHRSHGHYLAKGGDLNAMIAELHCRATGCSRGFGGSMHLIDTSVGHYGSSSIVGGGIPIGTGHALAFFLRGEARVSLVFFGDGASEEGVLYESVNFAVLKRLPVVYILENNGMAICSPLTSREPGPCIFHNAYPPDMLPAFAIDGNDVDVVFRAVLAAVERARKSLGPSFIECATYRMIGHMGCAAQDPEGYKDPSEVMAWEKKCPIKTYSERLLAEDVVTADDIENFEGRIKNDIDAAFEFALQSPFPDPSEAAGIVYCE